MLYTGDAYVYVSVTPINEFSPVFNPTTYFFSVSELLGSKAYCTANITDEFYSVKSLPQ